MIYALTPTRWSKQRRPADRARPDPIVPPGTLVFLGTPAPDATVHIKPQRRAPASPEERPTLRRPHHRLLRGGNSRPVSACSRSTSRLSWDPTGSDGAEERLVVLVVLVGV